MGRGDQRSRQGKVRRGTYGKTRPKGKKSNRAYKAPGTEGTEGTTTPPRPQPGNAAPRA